MSLELSRGATLHITTGRPYPPFRVCRPIRRTSFPDPPRYSLPQDVSLPVDTRNLTVSTQNSRTSW